MQFLELMATLGLDSSKYDRGLQNAAHTASSMGSTIAHGLGTIAKVSAVAIGAGAAGVTALTTAAVSSYGTYEQLVGGVNKIFEDSADMVMEYADRAYQTAGLSANQYMETVTSFSASLLQGLGGDTEAAADIADMAICDMADNANTYGTDMASIQNAYMGFAKNNYTMLDNLKLGYGGTQSEMVRLINDSGILEEKISDLDNVTFDQMIEAIHAVQENLNITDTTANEAAGTIQGSAGSLKAAWSNLITGLGDPSKDLGELIDNVVASASNMVHNIMPIATQALRGIGDLIKGVAPIIAEELPALLGEVVPDVIDAALSLVGALGQALIDNAPSIVDSVLGVMQTIIDTLQSSTSGSQASKLAATAKEILSKLGSFLVKNVPVVVKAVGGIIKNMVSAFSDTSNLESLKGVGADVLNTFVEGLDEGLPLVLNLISSVASSLLDMFTTVLGDGSSIEMLVTAATDILIALINGINSNSSKIISAAVTIITSLVNGISNNLPRLMPVATQAVLDIMNKLIAEAPRLLESGLQLIQSLTQGLLDSIPVIIDALPELIQGILTFLRDSLPTMIYAGVELFTALVEALPDIIEQITEVLPFIIASIVATLVELTPYIVDAGIKLFVALVMNLPEIISQINLAVVELLGSIVAGIIIGIADMNQAGFDLFMGVLTKIPDVISEIPGKIANLMNSIIDELVDWVEDMKDIGKNLIDGLVDGITSGGAGGKVVDAAVGVLGPVVSGAKKIFGINSPSKVFREIGQGLDEGFMLGIEDMADDITGTADDTFGGAIGALDNIGTDLDLNKNVKFNTVGDTLSSMVGEITNGFANQPIIIPVYIGDEKIDELVVNSNQRVDFVSGGRG